MYNLEYLGSAQAGSVKESHPARTLLPKVQKQQVRKQTMLQQIIRVKHQKTDYEPPIFYGRHSFVTPESWGVF